MFFKGLSVAKYCLRPKSGPLTILQRWDVWIWYRFKNKIEKHYHHDEEQQLRFDKNLNIKTYRLSKKKDILVIFSFSFLCRTKTYYKERIFPICLFDKSCTRDNAKCHILHEERLLRQIVLEQVKYE